jgi:hypothetical protein
MWGGWAVSRLITAMSRDTGFAAKSRPATPRRDASSRQRTRETRVLRGGRAGVRELVGTVCASYFFTVDVLVLLLIIVVGRNIRALE